jgi:hypothetical protein
MIEANAAGLCPPHHSGSEASYRHLTTSSSAPYTR